MAFLERKGLLNNTQHGFRSGRSCLSALLNVFDNLMNMIDSSMTVDMIYQDFSNAFDKVDHGIVLHKLRDIGITGNLGVWLHQFLSDRTQFVRVPGGVSMDSPVLSGVPQGTVLDPLLFIIMISDINKDILSSKIISFADDTRVYTNITQIENSDSLQTDLNYIYLWAINNNMLFNHQKFNYISFSSSMSSINTNVYYSPSLDIINPSENVLDLGITMSRNCSFDVHINILCKKCSDLSVWILRTFTSRDGTTLMTLFNALILSRLDYCSHSLQVKQDLSGLSVIVGDSIIQQSSKVRNLGIIFDQFLSFDDYISSVCRSTHFHLRNIGRIRHLLSQNAITQLIHALISIRLDYCNSILYNLPKNSILRLQRIQNQAARILTKTPCRDHITEVLIDLHWLRIEERIVYKLLILTFKAFIDRTAPLYLCELIEQQKVQQILLLG